MMTSAIGGRLGVIVLVGLLACADPSTAPNEAPDPTMQVVTTSITGSGGPYDGYAAVLEGSSCVPGKRGEMKARLNWQVSGDKPVKSFLLWLVRDDGYERQLTRKVLGSPRWSGVAAGFEYEQLGHTWKKARLELYSGAPDYPAPSTTITVDCGT